MFSRAIVLIGVGCSLTAFLYVVSPISSQDISIGAKNLSFISHYHKEIEIIYVQSGSITLFSGKREIDVFSNSGK